MRFSRTGMLCLVRETMRFSKARMLCLVKENNQISQSWNAVFG